MSTQACPCCSGKPLNKCCLPYITGAKKPVTVKQTMRARFSAYALGGYGDFLFHSWHPQTRGGLTANSLAQKTHDWIKLEVLQDKQEGDRSAIEFRAYYIDDKGATQCHHEFSQFLRNKGRWYYTDGKVQVHEVAAAGAGATSGSEA